MKKMCLKKNLNFVFWRKHGGECLVLCSEKMAMEDGHNGFSSFF
jgi:hypothetical protein